MQPQTCAGPGCGKTFKPTAPGQRYCPPTEHNRTVKGQARSKCGRRALNAQQRGEPTFMVPERFDCEWCGKGCVPGEDVVAHASRFCCKQHKAAWHKVNVEEPKRLLDSFTTPSRRMDEVAYRRAMRADPCAYCGDAPSNGIDHIEPKSTTGRDDWTNYTGCCRRCNGAKGTLPLLSALLWLPASRTYHDLRRTLWHAQAA